MNARIIRLKKEVRALFWPWLAVLIAGALPVIVPHRYAEDTSLLSFFVGIPLLATLSLSNEFQQRTLSLWLTQPASRMQLWGEKMSVMVPAVLSAGLVSGIVMFSVTWPHPAFTYQVAAIAYVLLAIASATFWTLAIRSTIGGFVLIGSFLYAIGLAVGEIENLKHPGEGFGAVLSPTATITIFVFGICYAGLMLWLGARKLARFQVTGGSADSDLLMTGPAVMPDVLAGWFRCRPSGAFLNLIRKEFRLLRPLWLIAFVVVLYAACLALFRVLPVPPMRDPRTVIEWAVVGPYVCLCVVIAGLAGTLSMGEERASGTQAWHMTLPVSALRQWLIKLVMAMLAGLACAALFPLLATIAGGSVLGSPFMYVDFRAWSDWLAMAPILTFACFWCACAANGTVRAVILVFPVTGAVFLARSGGMWLGQELARTTGTVRDLVLSGFHLSPLAFTTITDSARGGVLWLFVPALFFALIQSYRLFRTQPQDSVLWMLRCLMPLATVTILWSFSASAGFVSSRWEPLSEIRQALDKLQPGTAKLALTGEDLAKNSPLTALTRRWLRGSSIRVAPDHSHPSGYLATIHLASGLECRLTVAHYGGTAASCAYKGS